MKFTKLSLIATLAISSAFAGGDIAPVEPVVEAPVVEAAACNSNTTINSKAQLYYYSSDNAGSKSIFDKETSSLGAAVTVDVSHKIMDGITANVTGVGYTNLMNESITMGDFEGWTTDPKETGAFLNVANITATYGDTTLVAGRQLLNTPMLSGFDWLLAPGAFEAYTLVNTSIENVTIVGSYIEEYRANNSGTDFAEADGDNWTIGATYSDAFDASVWYYNVDHADYTQVYADAGTSISGFDLAAQFVSTDDSVDDSTTYGIKVGTKVADFDLAAAYVNTDGTAINNNLTVDGLYTTMWNSFAAGDEGDSWMVSAATEVAGISASLAYADYETIGNELDLILGYGVTDCISLDAIFTSTAYNETMDEDNALELIATYKF